MQHVLTLELDALRLSERAWKDSWKMYTIFADLI